MTRVDLPPTDDDFAAAQRLSRKHLTSLGTLAVARIARMLAEHRLELMREAPIPVIDSEERAQALSKALSDYYREPTMPISRYCAALGTWARVYTESHPGEAAEFSRMELRIGKSDLLKRLLYRGEALRTRPCPLHEGQWSGMGQERCPHGCESDNMRCGWLPNEAPAP